MRLLVLVALAGSATADDTPPPPKPLRVTAALDGDTARFAVRYLVRAERDATELLPQYALPRGGLVTAATIREGAKVHPLALVAAAKASEAFEALFEKAPSRARTSAVLLAVEPYRRGEFTIATAVPHRTSLVADVEIAAPTCFQRDARYVAVPAVWLARLPAAMRVRDGDAIAAACGAHDLGDLAWVAFPAPALASRRAGAERIGSYASRAVLGKTSVVKLELNLAARLSEVPADLATVIVVDGSRSMTASQLEAQAATVAAYLRATPQGRVQVVAYARHARALLPGWTTASLAAPRVARALQAMQRANGSSVSRGLREAGRWLAMTGGTRRIVVFTDEHLASVEAHAVDEALPPSTLVHVVAVGGTGLVRDDEAKLARLAQRTRGLSVRGGEPEQRDAKPVPLDATLLARPITLDHLRIRTPGWEALAPGRACPDDGTLPEGGQCTWWGRGDAVASPFVVEGHLWGERVERVLRADLGRSLEVVRELSTMDVLDEELQRLADRAARAVNAAWSLYATWGGDGGYNDVGARGGTGFGITCGDCGGGGGIGHGSGTGTLGAEVDLTAALERAVRTCRPDARLALEVETTLEEIVDVQVTGGSPALRTCVEEALWSTWLVEPRAPAQRVTRFTVAP